jgi:hypothetical protein
MSEHRLGEIVIERPRVGMRISAKKVTGYKKALFKLTQEALEDGLLSPYLLKSRYRSKGFSDNLSPLKRWLRSQLGQPWDIIYSALCQKIETRTLAGQHFIFHLWQIVEQDAVLIDGVPYSRNKVFRSSQLGYWQEQFYVHPETGVLCLAKKRRKEPPQKPDNVVFIDGNEYRKINDLWYLVTTSDIPEFGLQKRQCNKKEIKRIMQRIQNS